MSKGIILAGGMGTRLKPLTNIVNKHLLPVYNRPMIEYPLITLINAGCDDILVISGGENIGGFAEYLQDGSRYNVSITYRVQVEAGGIAQALMCAKGFVDGLFPVILGDNYFEYPVISNRPAIIIKEVDNPNRFGVYANGSIIEKPKTPISNMAVTGMYWYNDDIFDFIETMTPSARGELEITDLNNHILGTGALVKQYDGFWSDMGTFDSLIEVANHERGKNG